MGNMIDLAFARQGAIDRIVHVLREQYATEISALNTAKYSGELVVPAPADDAYYTDHPDITEDQLTNHAVAVHVWTGGPREIVESTTMGLQDYKVIGSIPIEVVILFRPSMREPTWQYNGRVLNEAEYIQRRGELYCGAAINTIYKYACERTADAAILDVELTLDEATPLYLDERRIMGLAGMSFRITQNTSAPLTRPLP